MAITKCSIVNMVHSLCELYCTVATYLVTGSGFVGVYLRTLYTLCTLLAYTLYHPVLLQILDLEGDWRIPIPPFLYHTPPNLL